MSTRVGVFIGLAALALLLGSIIAALAIFPNFRIAVRDIAIIILAILQMISAILLIVLLGATSYAAWRIYRLTYDVVLPKTQELTTKVEQVIESAHSITNNVADTTNTVSTTTVYVAEQVVTPVIRVSGLFAGVRAAASFLARRGGPSDLNRSSFD